MRMNSAGSFGPHKKGLSLSAAVLIASLLMLLWALPSTRQIFFGFDAKLFLFLNGSLKGNHIWALFWSLLNSRYTDLLVGLLMLLFLIWPDWAVPRSKALQTLCGFVVLLVLLLVIRMLLTVAVDSLGWQHASPSQVVKGVYYVDLTFPPRFTELWRIKAGSNVSFPGDHASVLLLWAFYMTHLLASSRKKIIVWLFTLFFILPRVVAGAHWASDIYIGGLSVAILSFVLGMRTGIVARYSSILADWALTLKQKLFPKIRKK